MINEHEPAISNEDFGDPNLGDAIRARTRAAPKRPFPPRKHRNWDPCASLSMKSIHPAKRPLNYGRVRIDRGGVWAVRSLATFVACA